jgi:hypothetical protein
MQDPNTALPSLPDSQWTQGVNSLLFPTDLPAGEYAWGVNVTNRGGNIQTRPGRRRVFALPGKWGQAFTLFLDTNSNYWMVWAIDGLIYASKYPFVTYQKLNFSFNPFARRLFFAQGIQAATYDSSSNIVVISPIRWLFIQDGTSSPGWWDPVGQQTVQKPVVPRVAGNQPLGYIPTLPIGTVMVYTDNRLWVAVGSKVYASDLFNPISFLEGTYLAEADGFGFPFEVQAMIPAPEDTGLYVCTANTIGQLDTQIQDRTQWQSTPNFQSTFSQEIGVSAPNGLAYAHGLLWLYSNKGLVSLNNALSSQITSVLYEQDGEMSRSRNRLSPDRSGVAVGLFQNMFFVAVPSGNLFNAHTWVIDGDIASLLMSQQPPCWTGVWTGTFPIVFGRLIDQGVEHLYEFSYSSGTVTDPLTGATNCGIQIWELMSQNQYDEAANVITPIRCSWESRLFVMPNEEWYAAGWVELTLVGLKGTVEFEIWVAGMSGAYIQVGTTHFVANVGPFGDPNQGTGGIIYYEVAGQVTSIARDYKAQNRIVAGPGLDTTFYQNNPAQFYGMNSPHNIETDRNDGIDKAFQVLLKWTGVCGVRRLRFFYRPETEQSHGGLPLANIDEVTLGDTDNVVLETYGA